MCNLKDIKGLCLKPHITVVLNYWKTSPFIMSAQNLLDDDEKQNYGKQSRS